MVRINLFGITVPPPQKKNNKAIVAGLFQFKNDNKAICSTIIHRRFLVTHLCSQLENKLKVIKDTGFR